MWGSTCMFDPKVGNSSGRTVHRSSYDRHRYLDCHTFDLNGSASTEKRIAYCISIGFLKWYYPCCSFQ